MKQIELWKNIKKTKPLGGNFYISFEGVSTSSLVVNATADDINIALEENPRMGNVSVDLRYREEIDTITGFTYNVTEYLVTFLTREGDVPDFDIDSRNITGMTEGEKFEVHSLYSGGIEKFESDVQTVTIIQAMPLSHIVDINITTPTYIHEVMYYIYYR